MYTVTVTFREGYNIIINVVCVLYILFFLYTVRYMCTAYVILGKV